MSTEQMCKHHTRVVADPQPDYKGPKYFGHDCDKVCVDPQLHTLLQVLWDKGYETQSSCQGWPYGSDGARHYGTRGYILFRRAEQAIDFFRETYAIGARLDRPTPKLWLETAIGMSEDMKYLDDKLPPRGTIRFEHINLKDLERLWTHA